MVWFKHIYNARLIQLDLYLYLFLQKKDLGVYDLGNRRKAKKRAYHSPGVLSVKSVFLATKGSTEVLLVLQSLHCCACNFFINFIFLIV